MLGSDERRLIINIDDVRSFDSNLANEYLSNLLFICRILQNPTLLIDVIESELIRVFLYSIWYDYYREQVVVVQSLLKTLLSLLFILALQDLLVVILLIHVN